MKKLIDILIDKINKTKAPIVVGLDPVIDRIPRCYLNDVQSFDSIADAIFEFNKDIIDTIKDLVPCVKPQIAFYEMYGSKGVEAFEKTVKYAKDNNLLVIEDGKRNDIGNTAMAYAQGHLGKVITPDGSYLPNFDVDFLTVSSYLGKESIEPFVKVCEEYNKGIFVLVKTSNKGNSEIQDVCNINGVKISEVIANYVNGWANDTKSENGYSNIGAVVGATYPEDAKKLRKLMPSSFFLVPGYGTQGGSSKDILPSFNEDGYGAVVNSSRGILYAYEKINSNCDREEYKKIVCDATKNMISDIYSMLKTNLKDMKY